MNRPPRVAESQGRGDLCLFWNGGHAPPDAWTSMGPRHAAQLAADGVPGSTGTAALAYVGPALDRLPLWDVVWLLEDIRRVLRPHATIRIGVYDALGAIDAFRRHDDDYLWESDWRGRSGRLADHLSQSGVARSLFSGELVTELLERAGFVDAIVCARNETMSGDERLVVPDPALRQCVFVEATAPAAPQRNAIELAPRGVRLLWTDHGMVVVWSAPPGSRGVVRVRESGAVGWTEVDADEETTVDGSLGPAVFRAILRSLQRGISYEYCAGQRDDTDVVWSGVKMFTAPPGPRAAVRLAFLADTGLAGRSDGLADGVGACIDAVVASDPSVVMCAGDYAYRSSDSRVRSGADAPLRWFDQMSRLAERYPLIVQFGNHEVALGERYRDWAPHVAAAIDGERSFSCDVGPCHVVGLHVPTSDVSPATVAWLEADLDAARDRGLAWTIVFQHQPLFAHGSSHPADDRVRIALARTLERHRVDLHLSAHDQCFERTFPLRGAGSVPVAASDSPDEYEQGSGVVYAKVSPAGKRSDRGRDFSALAATLPSWVAASGEDRHHVAVVHADEYHMVVETYGIIASQQPQLIDRFSITATKRSTGCEIGPDADRA